MCQLKQFHRNLATRSHSKLLVIFFGTTTKDQTFKPAVCVKRMAEKFKNTPSYEIDTVPRHFEQNDQIYTSTGMLCDNCNCCLIGNLYLSYSQKTMGMS